MNEKEKCELLIEKGYVYNSETGNITNPKGRILNSKTRGDYLIINCSINKKSCNVRSHRFGWYYVYKEIPDEIDHINRIRNDNRIVNLRNVTSQENKWNQNRKGYHWKKSHNKYEVRIKVNYKHIWIGLFNTEIEAREAYLKAKEQHHKIEYYE